MKVKIIGILVMAGLLSSLALPVPVQASQGLIKPSSRFHFLQVWGEGIKSGLIFNREKKLAYWIELAERRIAEIQENSQNKKAVEKAGRLYEKIEKKSGRILERLKGKKEKRQELWEKMKQNQLRHQEVLGRVYQQAPEQAKEALLRARENSQKNFKERIEAREGWQKAQEFSEKVKEFRQRQD